MTTTIVRGSRIGDAWIRQAVAAVPCQAVIDAKTGQPNGNFLTGPVRLGFTEQLFTAKASTDNPNSKPSYNAPLLWTPGADLTPIYMAWYQMAYATFPKDFVPQPMNPRHYGDYFPGLNWPFHDQGMKAQKYDAYTPGAITASASTQYMPSIVDQYDNPVVDQSRVYAGVWVIACVNLYHFNNKKRGVSLGLQSIMLIADDLRAGGGGVDTSTTFAGARGMLPPAVNPSGMFGQTAAPGSLPPLPAAPGYAPPQQLVQQPGGYYAPQQPQQQPGGYYAPQQPQQQPQYGGFDASQFTPPGYGR